MKQVSRFNINSQVNYYIGLRTQTCEENNNTTTESEDLVISEKVEKLKEKKQILEKLRISVGSKISDIVCKQQSIEWPTDKNDPDYQQKKTECEQKYAEYIAKIKELSEQFKQLTNEINQLNQDIAKAEAETAEQTINESVDIAEETDVQQNLTNSVNDNGASASYEDFWENNIKQPFNEYSEQVKKDLKSKYGYSDDYIEQIILFTIADIKSEKCSLQKAITKLNEYVKELTSTPDLHANAKFGPFGIERDLLNGNIYHNNMSIILNTMETSGTIQERFLAKIINDKFNEKNLSFIEQSDFWRLLFKQISNNKDEWDDYCIKISDFQNLNSNNDSSWFDELYNTINEKLSNIKHIEQSDIENANNYNWFDFIQLDKKYFKSAEFFLDNLEELLLSNDAGIRKIAQALDNAMYSFYSHDEKKQYLEKLFKIINYENGLNFRELLGIDTISELTPDKFIDYIKRSNEYTYVKNDYFKGDLYKINNNNNILTITNTKSSEATTIDLNKLVETLPDDKKENALKSLLQLPAEVIIDMWYESTFYDGSPVGTNGVYRPNNDMISLNVYEMATMTHETGHAIACSNTYGDIAYSSEFQEAFNECLNAYLADGNIKYEGHWDNDEYISDTDGEYCTSNPAECFAECYTLIMLGYTNHNENIIKKYFGKCLELTAKYLEKIRNLTPEQRRNNSDLIR